VTFVNPYCFITYLTQRNFPLTHAQKLRNSGNFFGGKKICEMGKTCVCVCVCFSRTRTHTLKIAESWKYWDSLSSVWFWVETVPCLENAANSKRTLIRSAVFLKQRIPLRMQICGYLERAERNARAAGSDWQSFEIGIGMGIA